MQSPRQGGGGGRMFLGCPRMTGASKFLGARATFGPVRIRVASSMEFSVGGIIENRRPPGLGGLRDLILSNHAKPRCQPALIDGI